MVLCAVDVRVHVDDCGAGPHVRGSGGPEDLQPNARGASGSTAIVSSLRELAARYCCALGGHTWPISSHTAPPPSFALQQGVERTIHTYTAVLYACSIVGLWDEALGVRTPCTNFPKPRRLGALCHLTAICSAELSQPRFCRLCRFVERWSQMASKLPPTPHRSSSAQAPSRGSGARLCSSTR